MTVRGLFFGQLTNLLTVSQWNRFDFFMKIRILYFNILDYCERLWNVFMINYQAPLNLINRRSAEFDNDHITEEFSKSEKI